MIKRLIYMGTPDFAVPPLKALISAGYEIAAVFTQPDKPRGRSGKMAPTPVKEVAQEAGIPVYTPRRVREEESVDLIRSIAPDVIVVAAFGQIIPVSILEIPPYGCINIHASLLPKYRGAAPIQRAVLDGEKQSGVTIMQMDKGLDTGDILLQRAVELAKDETGGSLFTRLSELGAVTIIEALEELESGRLTPIRQPEQSPTPYAAMLKKEDGCIDWTKDAASIERMIRGMDPWPGAYTHLEKKQLKLFKAAVEADPEKEERVDEEILPGTVVHVGKDHFTVRTGNGRLKILELQLEGKKRMESAAFLRGFSLKEGTVFTETR